MNDVRIRPASGEELLALWGYDEASAPPTARCFCRSIASGRALFWALECEGMLIGELYAFLDIEEDRDFADGETTAYLCAFRVAEAYRGQGLGRRLMETVLDELRTLGFRRATIGADGERQERLYRRLGFDTLIKECYYDPCARDENMRPLPVEEGYVLLAKEL